MEIHFIINKMSEFYTDNLGHLADLYQTEYIVER